jgi:heavy metal sensor kinase
MWFSKKTLKLRLTLLYVSLLTGVLLLYAGWTGAFLFKNLKLELDSSLERDINTFERLVSFNPDGSINVDTDSDTGYLLEVWSDDGSLLYRTPQLNGESLGEIPARPYIRKPPNRSLRLSNGTHVRIISRRHRVGSRTVLIRIAVNEKTLWDEFRKVGYLLALGLPAAICIVGVTGFFVAGRALRPVDSMARRAEKINANNLNERITIRNANDELGHLGSAFNETLSRLERSFGQIKSFTADAAHEFRTPLASIINVGEVALQKSGDARYYRDIVGSMLEEAHHLTQLVDMLLTLSRADAGFSPIEHKEVCLLDVARETVSLLEVLAEEKNQSIEIGGNQSLSVAGDRLILRQALVAIIHNAINYTPPNGSIRVWVDQRENCALIEVTDTGPGIAPEHRKKVFERFYRVDRARTREWGGAGLGLSIAKWAVEAHGGTLDLKCEPGPGCTFSLQLPVRAAMKVELEVVPGGLAPRT